MPRLSLFLTPLAVLLLYVQDSQSAEPLTYTKHNDLSEIWTDKGGRAKKDGSFWAPQNMPEGFFFLGHHGKAGHKVDASDFLVLVKPSEKDDVAPPVSLEFVYDDSGTGATTDVTVFNPKPAPGYTCLGQVALRAHRQATPDEFPGLVCVKTEYTLPAVAGTEIWNDKASKGKYDFSAWTNMPSSLADGLDLGTFVGHRQYSKPLSHPNQHVLKKSAAALSEALGGEKTPATSGTPADQQVISIRRGSSQIVTCGSRRTVSVLEAGYAETAPSRSEPPSYAQPVCNKNLPLIRKLYETCELSTATCLIKAQDSLEAPAGCRWKFLVVTYKCNESKQPHQIKAADYGNHLGGPLAA